MSSHLARIAERFNAAHDFDFEKHCVLLARIGSDSHGTHIPPVNGGIDDVDYFAVVLPPSGYLLGLKSYEGWNAQWEELDVVVYSFHKFVRLLTKANPNVLGTLWLREEDYVRTRWPFEELRENRTMFATKRAHASFAGYANGQMKDMTAYSAATQAQIDDLEHRMATYGWSVQDIMDRRPRAMPPTGVDVELANRQAEHLRGLRAKYHSAYMGEKRRSLVRAHGYDTKNAAHLLRLLSMCAEFLHTGEMRVWRGDFDADVLMDVKRGHYSLEWVKDEAERLFALTHDYLAKSTLPDGADMQAINDMVTTIVSDVLFFGM